MHTPMPQPKGNLVTTPGASHLSLRCITLFLALLFTIFGCTNTQSDLHLVRGIVVDQTGSPVSNAVIRIQATHITTTSSLDGSFEIHIPQSNDLYLTAWAPGYFNAVPVRASNGSKSITLTLQPHPNTDHPDYQWQTSLQAASSGDEIGCAECHRAKGRGLEYALPVDEWLQDAHANTIKNPRFQTMYLGTDIQGNQSPLTEYVNTKDYGTAPKKPDLSRPYFGPGYRLDFPETAGNCANCHAPAAAVSDPYNTDPLRVEGVAAEGVPCDFCHKVWDVILDESTQLPNQNMPGVLSFVFRRPPAGQQFFAGPFDDVAPGEDTYSALQTQSQFCAPCHFGVFWDVVVYDSYGEWLRSPYNQPENGKTCQDCHMPHPGGNYFALPDKGGLFRDPETIFGHLMPGAGDPTMLQNAVDLEVTMQTEGTSLVVEVSLTNDQTGHYVPTGSPLRQLILVVKATDADGEPLLLQEGPLLPDWTGVGDPGHGYYANQPGKAYAKILAEQWTNITPTGAYWNPTYLLSDNRLAPFETDTSRYLFELPEPRTITIHAQLYYRRAFIDLADLKGWQIPDILMEEHITEISPQN